MASPDDRKTANASEVRSSCDSITGKSMKSVYSTDIANLIPSILISPRRVLASLFDFAHINVAAMEQKQSPSPNITSFCSSPVLRVPKELIATLGKNIISTPYIANQYASTTMTLDRNVSDFMATEALFAMVKLAKPSVLKLTPLI